MRSLVRRIRVGLGSEDGMATVEYAVGTLAAAALAAVLYTVVTGQSVVTMITGLIERALTIQF